MAKTPCNVFMPIENDGEPWTLATFVEDDAGIEWLGRDLWMGSRHYAMQAKLAAGLGGALASIAPDGSFEHWMNNGAYLDDKFMAKLLRHAGHAESVLSRPDLAWMWNEELSNEGRVPKELRDLMDEVPMRARVGRRLGVGEKASRVLAGSLPTAGDILGTRSKEEVPIFVGEESAEFLSVLLAGFDPAEDDFDDHVVCAQSYLFAQGRWLTAVMVPDPERPIHWGGGEVTVAWIPASQAYAALNDNGDFSEGEAEHLQKGLTEQDREDLLAAARSMPADLFFQGSKLARAWVERCEAEREIELAAGPGVGSRRPGTL